MTYKIVDARQTQTGEIVVVVERPGVGYDVLRLTNIYAVGVPLAVAEATLERLDMVDAGRKTN